MSEEGPCKDKEGRTETLIKVEVAEVLNHEIGVIGFNLFECLPFKNVHVKGTGER